MENNETGMVKAPTYTLPSVEELYSDKELAKSLTKLNTLLNCPPKADWVKEHPFAKVKKGGKDVPATYIPIERIEYLLTSVYISWTVEVKSVQLIANSVVVTIKLGTLNPITNQWEYTEGVGAAPINTSKGAGATEFDKILPFAVQTAVPAAKSYAIKDAAETKGKLFGKDLNRADEISYGMLATKFDGVDISHEDLSELFELKKEQLTKEEVSNATRILENKEQNSYSKLFKLLQSK